MAAGIGEILWDMLPEGRQLGGAPANFAYHFNEMGGQSLTISRVGDDEPGRTALAQLQQQGLNIDAVTVDPEHETGRVDVFVDENGIASYIFPDHVAWDYIEANEAASKALSKLDAVCFGTLAQRNAVARRNIMAILKKLPQKTLKIFDINLRKTFFTRETIETSLHIADVLKINDVELEIVGKLFGVEGSEEEKIQQLIERFSLTMGALTRGEKGSLLMTRKKFSDHPGIATAIRDTIGAGDSFTAALGLGWLQGLPLGEINRRASEVAAFVCSQSGAMPPLPKQFHI